MKIDSDDFDIRRLFGSYYFIIPRFQRPYSWDISHVRAFWDDLIGANGADYFIGAMVSYEVDTLHLGVVDGQQRITTLTIILCALREVMKLEGLDSLASGVHRLVEKQNIDDQNEFVLTSETSFPYFQDAIQRNGEPELGLEAKKEEQGLEKVYKFSIDLIRNRLSECCEGLKKGTDPYKIATKDCLVGIREAILDLKVILVKLGSEEDAYIIFETLNARGKDLQLSDLVKNHIFRYMKSKSASIDSAKERWKIFVDNIESSSVDLDRDTFVHHQWLSKMDYVTAKNTFSKVKEVVGADGVESYLNDLVADSRHYKSIFEPSEHLWDKNEKEVGASLEALIIFRVKQPTPLLLALVRSYKNKVIRLKMLRHAISLIEKFHFQVTAVCSQPSSGGISKMYAALAREVSSSASSDEVAAVVVRLKEKLAARVPSFDEFSVSFSSIEFSNKNTKRKSLVRYILSKFLVNEIPDKAMVDFRLLSIEHLAPQSSSVSRAGESSSVLGLGNLFLIPEGLNNKLSTKSFKQKLSIAYDERFPFPAEVSECESWNKEEIVSNLRFRTRQAYETLWKL